MKHIVDQFVEAVYPNWPDAPTPPPGRFRVGVEVARRLTDHASRYGWAVSDHLFGIPVQIDPKLNAGDVFFQPDPSDSVTRARDAASTYSAFATRDAGER